jgi:hypothetical protein
MKEKIKHLYELQAILLNQYDLNFKRNIYDEIKWQHRVT